MSTVFFQTEEKDVLKYIPEQRQEPLGHRRGTERVRSRAQWGSG